MNQNIKQQRNIMRLWMALCAICGMLAVVGGKPAAAQAKQTLPATGNAQKMGGLQLTKSPVLSDGISAATPFIVALCLTQEQCLATPLVVTNNNPTPVRTIANGGAFDFRVECLDTSGRVVGVTLTLIPNQIQAGMSCPADAVEMVVNCPNTPCVVGWVP